MTLTIKRRGREEGFLFFERELLGFERWQTKKKKASAVDESYFGCRFPWFRFKSGHLKTRMWCNGSTG